jgi:hypothetical protein
VTAITGTYRMHLQNIFHASFVIGKMVSEKRFWISFAIMHPFIVFSCSEFWSRFFECHEGLCLWGGKLTDKPDLGATGFSTVFVQDACWISLVLSMSKTLPMKTLDLTRTTLSNVQRVHTAHVPHTLSYTILPWNPSTIVVQRTRKNRCQMKLEWETEITDGQQVNKMTLPEKHQQQLQSTHCS